PGDHPERGRLACAVWTEKSVDLAGADIDRDAVDGGERSVGFDQLLNRNHLHTQHDDSRRGTGSWSASTAAGCWRPTMIGVELGATSRSRIVIFTRPTSGRIAACFSRPPRASRRCVASAGN